MSDWMEATLNRLFSTWTDDEVRLYFEQVREGMGIDGGFSDLIWREHLRRSFPANVVCGRCGSDNHGTAVHESNVFGRIG